MQVLTVQRISHALVWIPVEQISGEYHTTVNAIFEGDKLVRCGTFCPIRFK